jgi:arylsulfatase
MDPLEKMDPDSEEFGYIGKQFFANHMWAPNAAGPFIAEHLKSLMEFPPRQKADTLNIKKALEDAMKKMENPKGGNN